MKKFHIKAPRTGEQSASIVGYEYDVDSRRTRTIYLGSFSIHASPEDPRWDMRMRPNRTVGGEPVELTKERIDLVREWLETHGTYRVMQRAQAAERERQRVAKEIEEQERVRQIEVKVRARLEAEWRAEFDATLAAREQEPLTAAVEAITHAGRFLKSESERLRRSGSQLSRVRSTQLNLGECKTELDLLQGRANQLRLRAFEAFSVACKEAGLMATQLRRLERRAS